MQVHLNLSQIDALLDDELIGNERATLLAHCDACKVCWTQLEARRALHNVICSVRPREKAPASLREKVTAILDAEQLPRSKQDLLDQFH